MARVQKNDEGQLGDPAGPSDAENGSLPEKENGQNLDFAITATPDREQWASKIDFILSCIGFAVGLGNVWRFPYLCYKNGGGAFLIPYFFCLVCGGVPVFFLEVSLGQYMSQGGLGVWKICPLFQGIGVATTVITFLLNIYYIVILAWDVYYMGMSFTSVLPWSHCNNSWNTYRCTTSFKDRFGPNLTLSALANETSVVGSHGNNSGLVLNANFTPVDPVVEFWEYKVLKISGGVDQPDGIVWELALSLLICWVLCYFCIWKGIKWTGKVVYFTATFPYVILTVLLVRGLTLPGASDGLIFYLRPDFSRLAEAQVWIDAGTQIFFSYAIALGAMTALGSYNKFNNDCYKDCMLIAGVNSFTSLYAGFVIFSVLGFMAYEQGVSIDQVAESGPGLAFIAYPKAVTRMPLAPLWAVLFFFMIIMLGLDSQFVGVEAFITVVSDLFPIIRKKWYKETFVAVYTSISYLIGLTMVTKGGMYVFQLFDYYCASGMALLWVCFFECVVIGWIYGGHRFYDNLEQMIGYRINPWLRICWTYITPVITVGIMVFTWIQFTPLTYNRVYEYPGWAQGLGMTMAFSSMICIPGYFAVRMIFESGSIKQRWRKLTTPLLKPHQIPDHWDDGLKLAALQAAGCVGRVGGGGDGGGGGGGGSGGALTSSVKMASPVVSDHEVCPFITHRTDLGYKVAPPQPHARGYQGNGDLMPELAETKVPLVD